MKMKFRKVFPLLLVLIMALSITACGGDSSDKGNKEQSGEQTALELYNAANKQLEGSDSYSAAMDTKMSMDVAGQKMDVTMVADMKQQNMGDNPKLEMDMATTSMGQEMEMKAYYKDGYYYMDSNGQKIKMKMDVADVMKQMGSASLEIGKDAVKEQSVTDGQDGKELNMTLDGQKIMDQASGLMAGLDQYSAMADEMKMGDMSLNAVVGEDGNLKSTDIDFSITMTIQKQETTMDAKVTMDIEKIGGIKVEFPDDLDSYKETEANTAS